MKSSFHLGSIAVSILIVLTYCLMMGCNSGGGGGDSDYGSNVKPISGAWSGENLIFQINSDATAIFEFKATYSGHADGTSCNFDYKETIAIDSITIENGSFFYSADGYEIFGTFSDENNCEIDFAWDLYDANCKADYSGTSSFFAEYFGNVISIPTATISIDGIFSDWDTVPALFTDAVGDVYNTPNADIKTAYLARDEEFIYLRVDVVADFEDKTFIGFRFEPSNLEFALHYGIPGQSVELREWDYAWDDPVTLMSYPNYFAVVNGNQVEFKIRIADLTKSIDFNRCRLSVWDNSVDVFDDSNFVFVDFSLTL